MEMTLNTAAEQLSNFVFSNSYARYNDKAGRRETFSEAIDRMVDMHVRRYPHAEEEIREAFKSVYAKRVLASQRALQYGGAPVELRNMRMFNCSTSFCDRLRFFAEALYMGLCGCGVGFSVQKVHVDRLPELQPPSHWRDLPTREVVVSDDIEGWAESVYILLKSFFGVVDFYPEFNYSKIRAAGAPLSSGGFAPGPDVLESAVLSVERKLQVLSMEGVTRLRPIHCFDIVMMTQEAVRNGGRRRSATIAIFDKDDEEMLSAKIGNWREEHPYRQLANISARLDPDDTTQDDLNAILSRTREFGEPGVIFARSPHFIYNPCCEIGMCPTLIKDAKGKVLPEYTLSTIDDYAGESGWQVCNLTEINGGVVTTEEELRDAVRAATVIGTLQAGYTDTGYLDWENGHHVSKQIIERESLLGVSITGIMANPQLMTDLDVMSRAAKYAIDVNRETAALIGIAPAARVTCVKPSGTTSTILATSAGVHPYHARRYIRYVQISRDSVVLNHFRQFNSSAVEDSVWNSRDCAVAFPIDTPAGALTYDDLSATQFIDIVLAVQNSWVRAGTALPMSCEGLTHNVSNTVSVRDSEWEDVGEALWAHRKELVGIAMLGAMSRGAYPQLPYTPVPTEEELAREEDAEMRDYLAGNLARFNALREQMCHVDYSMIIEENNLPAPSSVVACAGGVCDVDFSSASEV